MTINTNQTAEAFSMIEEFDLQAMREIGRQARCRSIWLSRMANSSRTSDPHNIDAERFQILADAISDLFGANPQ